ncbi:MAG: response regulator [Gemmataceae bacterium]|nr:response regulator [Gemmataceae bacterium]
MSSAKSVLVIDDDEAFVAALEAFLVSRGYRVITAEDGEAGIQAAKTHRPDLVVVDMMMPRKSGFLVLDALKQDRKTAVKIVMITANEGSRHRAYAELLGADAYLRKPFAMDQFYATINELCPPTL